MTDQHHASFEIQHVSTFQYEFPISWATMMLRLEPRNDERQKVVQFDYEIAPRVTPITVFDSFGNKCHLLNFRASQQSSLTIKSKAKVETTISNAVVRGDDDSTWDYLHDSIDTIDCWEFLAPSKRVYDCPLLQDFMVEHNLNPSQNRFISLVNAARTIFQQLRYEPGTTEVSSTIDDCLKLRSGVCQDFTHIMLAIGRLWGIPSRYVSGYLHLYADIAQIVTDDASHAWSEFYFPECGWVGIDATNDRLVDHRYIRLSVGRDYEDVAPTKGVIFGGGNSSLYVNVTLAHHSLGTPSAELLAADQ